MRYMYNPRSASEPTPVSGPLIVMVFKGISADALINRRIGKHLSPTRGVAMNCHALRVRALGWMALFCVGGFTAGHSEDAIPPPPSVEERTDETADEHPLAVGHRIPRGDKAV